jgi:Zn-dependent M32 family carboxypeptidase
MALSPYQQLEQEFRRLHAFRGATSLLRWDAAVMMPRGSASVRGEQLAALESECHALLTTPRMSRLLERALPTRRSSRTGNGRTCARCAASATGRSPRRCRW